MAAAARTLRRHWKARGAEWRSFKAFEQDAGAQLERSLTCRGHRAQRGRGEQEHAAQHTAATRPQRRTVGRGNNDERKGEGGEGASMWVARWPASAAAATGWVAHEILGGIQVARASDPLAHRC